MSTIGKRPANGTFRLHTVDATVRGIKRPMIRVHVEFPQFANWISAPGGNPGHLRDALFNDAPAAVRYATKVYPGIAARGVNPEAVCLHTTYLPKPGDVDGAKTAARLNSLAGLKESVSDVLANCNQFGLMATVVDAEGNDAGCVVAGMYVPAVVSK